MKLGFTGTRQGMTEAQDRKCYELLFEMQPEESHHGDCIGADAQFELNAMLAMHSDVHTVAHPSTLNRLRAYCNSCEIREPKEPLERNRDIVDETDQLIAAPSTYDELPRSGTWSTIRYALKVGKPVTIVWPDGTTREYQTERCPICKQPMEFKGRSYSQDFGYDVDKYSCSRKCLT
jgi:hypothetical protein